jgi:uncharacterized protein YutE (UPF0331/DUF86 family)
MDRERIVKIVSDIEKYMNDLEEMNIRKAEDLTGIEKYYATSMILFSLLNRVIDLAQEVVVGKKLGMPSSYKEIFRILRERDFISKETLGEIEKLVELRNILSHEYYRIGSGEIFRAVKNVGVVRKFVSEIKRRIE